MTLSPRQQKILEFIEGYLAEHHFPPTIREIGAAVGISSTSVVNYNLKKLEESGYINRNPDVSRGIRILKPTRLLTTRPGQSTTIRLLGRIAAGEPIPVPDQNPFGGETIELADLLVSDAENVYALEVRGDSMIDALVADGDLVILRYQQTAHNGDMVAAWLKDREETTLKYFYLEGDHVRLQPANPSYQPIYVSPQQMEIQGKVIAVVRRLA